MKISVYLYRLSLLIFFSALLSYTTFAIEIENIDNATQENNRLNQLNDDSVESAVTQTDNDLNQLRNNPPELQTEAVESIQDHITPIKSSSNKNNPLAINAAEVNSESNITVSTEKNEAESHTETAKTETTNVTISPNNDINDTQGETADTDMGMEEEIHHEEEENAFGTLESTYLQLSFQQGHLTQRFRQGDKHQAIARISSKGTGQMYVGWEIVRPPFSSQADPIFIPIQRAQNMIAGNQQTDFLSPTLPSDQLGKYLLRVNVTTPKNGKQSAVLRYYITQAGQQTQIQLLSPISGITANKNTLFKWQLSSQANQSSLQIFDHKNQRSHCNIQKFQSYLTAIATQGVGRTKITPIAAHKLQHGQHYCWRVQNYEQGRLVASSEIRTFIWENLIPVRSSSDL